MLVDGWGFVLRLVFTWGHRNGKENTLVQREKVQKRKIRIFMARRMAMKYGKNILHEFL